MEQEKKDLEKFLHQGSVWMIPFGAFFLVLGVAMLVQAMIAGLILLALGGLMIWSCLGTNKTFKQYMTGLEEGGQLPALLAEFQRGKRVLNGSLVLGERHLFGKGSSRIVGYEELRQIYQQRTRTNFIETARTLRVVLTDGKVLDIGQLKLRGKSDEELLQVVQEILQRNPAVKVGYQ